VDDWKNDVLLLFSLLVWWGFGGLGDLGDYDLVDGESMS
jgi:hypothetical protein